MIKNKLPNVSFVVRNDLCTGCGVCQGACPSKAVEIVAKDGLFHPIVDSSKCNNSKGCHRCYDVCPGVGVDIARMADESFADDGVVKNELFGRYLKCFSGYSNDDDIRLHSASGGLVTQFLIWLLENGEIDGAVVTRFDKSNPLMVSSFIATTKEEIVSGRSSRYAPVTLSSAVQHLMAAPGNRYVVVGVPCHIQGFRKLMRVDKRLNEKVVGLFSIYCSCGRNFYLTEFVFKERNINRDNLTYFQYRDDGCLGYMKAKADGGNIMHPVNKYGKCSREGKLYVYKEPFQSYYHPLKSFFVPKRCLLCIDHYGELGDVCFGDIHTPPYIEDKVGVNSMIVRSQRWLELLRKCHEQGKISLDEIPFEVISKSQRMSFKKKGRNGAFINICKKLGKKIPYYDVDYLRQPTLYDWVDYAKNRIQQFIGRHKNLWWIISRVKAKVKVD